MSLYSTYVPKFIPIGACLVLLFDCPNLLPTFGRAWWCLLRPRPRVVWCSTGFRVGAYTIADFYKWSSRKHKFNSPPFADDCVLYRNKKGSENQQLLQDDLEKLALWEEAHGSWNSISPNVTLWEWQGIPLINRLSMVIHYITKF